MITWLIFSKILINIIFNRLKKLDKIKIEKKLFGSDSSEVARKIRRRSAFGGFESWRLVHLIVKTGDNLKQE